MTGRRGPKPGQKGVPGCGGRRCGCTARFSRSPLCRRCSSRSRHRSRAGQQLAHEQAGRNQGRSVPRGAAGASRLPPRSTRPGDPSRAGGAGGARRTGGGGRRRRRDRQRRRRARRPGRHQPLRRRQQGVPVRRPHPPRPACVSRSGRSGADNGGATAQGVTADTIKIIYFESTPNEQVNTILGAKGLATSDGAGRRAFYAAAFKFIQQHYEFYGRKLEIKRIIGDCPTTPPDYDKCNAAAQKVLEEHPFMVVWGTPLYADIFDVWAQNGIIAVGGWHFDDKYFNDRRPYRYDVFMDGTQSADFIAEYYCKKMAGQPADHAGTQIHPLIGGRNTTRKLGHQRARDRGQPDDGPARRGPGQGVPRRGRRPDLHLQVGHQHGDATDAGDGERAHRRQGHDGRLYVRSDRAGVPHQGHDRKRVLPRVPASRVGPARLRPPRPALRPQQMQHAFGPSHLYKLTSLDETDAARVWRAEGKSGHPCGNNGCGIQWGYTSLVATAIQMAGPEPQRPLLRGRRPVTPAGRKGQPAHTPREVRAERLHRDLRHQGGVLGSERDDGDRRHQGRLHSRRRRQALRTG